MFLSIIWSGHKTKNFVMLKSKLWRENCLDNFQANKTCFAKSRYFTKNLTPNINVYEV